MNGVVDASNEMTVGGSTGPQSQPHSDPSADPIADPIDQDVKKNVVAFLRDLADKLENDRLSSNATLEVSQFFMKFCFIDALDKELPESEEMMKFLSLGWYVYKFLANTGE